MGVVKCSGFSLAHTLDSGQFFRYSLIDDWYYIVTRNKVFRVRQQGDVMEFEGASERLVRHFFGLDEDYAQIKRELGKDAVLAKAIKAYPGLRLLRQDPWECTIAFLCSQFSNIKKIKRNLDCIAVRFGKPVIFKGRTFYTFPKPGGINDLTKLKECAVGFRTKYIMGVNARVSDAYFAKLQALPYKKAKEKLMELPGVGEKVADCILLFSLGFTESFPVDLWVERVVSENYFDSKKVRLKQLAEFGRKRWGRLAGYAQQWLYHWRRLHGKNK